jgi:hypothetical protein
MRIIVCQASYGDTLGIEIDEDPPKSYSSKDRIMSKSRKFMLIDGGPATIKPTGTVGKERIPLQVRFIYLQPFRCLITNAGLKLRTCTECLSTSSPRGLRASTP